MDDKQAEQLEKLEGHVKYMLGVIDKLLDLVVQNSENINTLAKRAANRETKDGKQDKG